MIEDDLAILHMEATVKNGLCGWCGSTIEVETLGPDATTGYKTIRRIPAHATGLDTDENLALIEYVFPCPWSWSTLAHGT